MGSLEELSNGLILFSSVPSTDKTYLGYTSIMCVFVFLSLATIPIE